MAKLFANSADRSDQMLYYAASDLGLHCFPITLLGVARLKCVNASRKIKADDILKKNCYVSEKIK